MLVFLKLGGSLITVKDQPRVLRPDVLRRLMTEIAEAVARRPALRLVLGHGSGSYGHAEAQKHGTRQGARTPDEWRGYAEVQRVAGLLNRLVVDAACEAGLPVVNLPPSASTVCRDGAVLSMELRPLRSALEHGLVPLVYGDVAIDEVRGATIVSTEDVFAHLAIELRPSRLLLAGIEPGVLSRWPDGAVVPALASDASLAEVGGSHGYDVTGGMASKVRQMQALAAAVPDIEIRIFSGEVPGLVRSALLEEAAPGTAIRA